MNRLTSLLLLVAFVQDAPPEQKPPARVRGDFLKLIDRPRVAPEPEPMLVAPDALPQGVIEEFVSIAVERHDDGTKERVPIVIVRPDKEGRLPAVILLHGTGGSASGMFDWSLELAKRGIVGVAIDGRHHGRRANGQTRPLGAYNDAIIRAWEAKPGDPKTYPFYFDTAYDVSRVIDYLQTRTDIDPNRIGLFGISKGGIETWLAGAVDDRVKVAVPAISVQSFRWSLDHDQWQGRANTIAAPHARAAKDRGEKAVTRETCRALWSKIIPGMLDEFDCPQMLRLFAGRPLLIINGETDPNCPIGGAKIAFASAEAAYREANASDRLKIDVAPRSGHAITEAQKAMILDWFSKWL